LRVARLQRRQPLHDVFYAERSVRGRALDDDFGRRGDLPGLGADGDVQIADFALPEHQALPQIHLDLERRDLNALLRRRRLELHALLQPHIPARDETFEEMHIDAADLEIAFVAAEIFADAI